MEQGLREAFFNVTGGSVSAQAAAGFDFEDGSTSEDLRSGLYAYSPLAAVAAAEYGTQTISNYLASANPPIKATTVLNPSGIEGANRIYLNPIYWGSDYYGDRSTVLHELLHSVTGFTDSDFARKFGSMQNFNKAVQTCGY